MNRAIIDIGTNSVRLLEARKSETGEWDVVRKEINSTRLGEGMTESASIADGSRHRTLKAIEEFAAMARSDGFTDIRAYGTSIMRDAKEGSEFADEITSTSGVPVRILSGREEAYYSYIGRGRHFCRRDFCGGYRRRFYGNMYRFQRGYRYAV